MFVELLMKKNGKIIFGLFLVIFAVTTILGGVFVYNTLNTDFYTFKKDGYVLGFNSSKNSKAIAYSFKNGTEYQFKKNSNSIKFKTEEKKVKLDENSVIHYSDGSLGVLKKVVGIDVSTINKNIIFYYNIYKDTNINSTAEGYNIKLANEQEVNFKNLLVRVSDNKFVLTGKNIRLVLGENEIVDFGTYVEFEYVDGNVIKVYNQDKYYQTISKESTLLTDDVKIDLSSATISKANKKYITLTNLVIDNNGNIDALEEEIKKEQIALEEGNVDLPEIEVPDSSVSDPTDKPEEGGTAGDDEDQKEEVEDPDQVKKTPTYKVSELNVSALKVEAKIDIIDEDNLITSDTLVQIVENKTAKVIFEDTSTVGDANIMISCADLKPDTEYTLYAKATYEIDKTELDRYFLSKIFRTEDLGVSFKESYVTDNSLTIEVRKENYSKVNSIVLEIYGTDGRIINYTTVTLGEAGTEDVTFGDLTSNTTYMIKMTEILCQGVVVDEGYSEQKMAQTLKKKPEIGTLSYEVDKRQSLFNVNVDDLKDEDYGIKGYRYEIYDAREEMAGANPVATISASNLATTSIKIDGVKVHRGIPYTYVMVVEFNDNEKIVEYTKELGTTMTLDGIQFPTIRFDEESSDVTWEQINGTIIIEDPYNAIMSNEYQVVYRNSIDVYTSTKINADSDTGDIPININGLRANETYTFQVYGTVNLQDGNETANSVYIGSVYVQTKKPQSLKATFTPVEDFSEAYAIEFRLGDKDGEDASLEASTLSEITFTIYKGSTTEGGIAVSKKTVDLLDTDPYQSTIKFEFYDKSTIINPKFFDSNNTDYYEDIYTLEVSNALDYTRYKNKIPIENNTYSFKLNSTLPDIPDDPNDAVVINTITNNTAAAFDLIEDDTLAGNTVVGYGLLPKFNNDNKKGKKVIWHVYMYDHQKKEFVLVPSLGKEQMFKENGELDYTIFELSNGTSYDVVDTDKLRRGNVYYFTYEIEIDNDGDGVVEDTTYPEIARPGENMVLKSEKVYPIKQEAQIKMYPSTSAMTTYTWKYKVIDVDNILEENKLYSVVDGSQDITSSPNILPGEETYNSATFTNLQGDKVITLKKQERRLKSETAKYKDIVQQYFYGVKTGIDLNYTVKAEVNKLVIRFEDYDKNYELINSISSVDIVITPIDIDDRNNIGSKTFKGYQLDSETINIDYFQLSDYKGIDIKVDLVAYYDSGRMGFDLTSDYVALQKISNQSVNNYYTYDGRQLSQNTLLTNSVFKTNLDLEGNILTLTTTNNKYLNLEIDINESGVIYKDNNIILKELASTTLTSDSNQAMFDTIIPGISMLDDSDRMNIKALLDTADIKAKIYTDESIDIKKNEAGEEMFYVELYSTDENGANAQLLGTYPKTLTELTKTFTITGLVPKTNYYLKFYTEVMDNTTNEYKKTYLYDIDDLKIENIYNFYTLTEVNISGIKWEMRETAYTNKQLIIKYNLDVVYGYEKINYTLQKYEGAKWKNISSRSTAAFFSEMSISFGASPGNELGITYDTKYRIIISPVGTYTDQEGNAQLLDLGTKYSDFTLTAPQIPLVGITTGKTETSIIFRVSVSDPDYIINGGTYYVKLLNSRGEQIAISYSHNILDKNKKFEYTNTKYPLVEGEEYTFVVTTKLDKTNTKAGLMQKEDKKTIKYGDSVELGVITTSKNATNPKKIDIIFQDAYKLETITRVQVTISNPSAEFYHSVEKSFTVRYDATKNLYYYTIDLEEVEEFTENNMYTIGMNFYSGGELVAQAETSYYYSA